MNTTVTADMFQLNANEIDLVSGAKVSDDTLYEVGAALVVAGLATSELGVGIGLAIAGGAMMGWALGGK